MNAWMRSACPRRSTKAVVRIALCAALAGGPVVGFLDDLGFASKALLPAVPGCNAEVDSARGWAASAEDARVTITAEDEGHRCQGESVSGATYVEYRLPLELCGSRDTALSGRSCVGELGAEDLVRSCLDGSRALDPLVRRVLSEDEMPVGPWVQVDDGCPHDPQAEVVFTMEDFRSLPLSASVASYQPSTGTGLVNMELIVFTDPAAQVLQTTVLGTPVTVRATPTEFSWDFGDGTGPLVTTDPGAPYPQFRVFHVYREAGSYLVQLTTTWSGEFQVNGQGPWYPVTGTAQTTSPAYPETIVEAKSRLVDGPLP